MSLVLRRAGRVTLYLFLTVGAVAMLYPLFWMATSAFKPLAEVMQVPPTWWPQHPTLDNFKAVFRQIPFAQFFVNSVIVSAVCVVSVTLTSAAAGYALAKFRFRGRELVFYILVASLVVPFQSRMIPLYELALDLHIKNTLLGVIFPWLVDAFGVFLMRQFMLSVPDELIEAARVDGAGEIRIFTRIVMPLTISAMSTVAIFTFLATWEEFLWPLIITDDNHARTIPVGLQTFSEQYLTNVHWQMAGALVATIPLFLMFAFFQRQIIAGIAMSGLKG